VIVLIQTVAIALAISHSPQPLTISAAWNGWHEARPIETGSSTRGLVRLVIPTSVYGKSTAGLSDLRVIDDASNEVPYAVDQRLGSSSLSWDGVPLSEQGFVRGQYTQAVADVGTGGSLHNAVTIDTSGDEFSNWVEVAASGDEKTWRIVRDRAPIFRYSSEGLPGNLVVHFAATRDRWLRVRVLRGDAEFPISGCLVANDVRVMPDLSVVASGLTPGPDAPPQQTRIAYDFGAENIPVSSIRFASATPAFYRTVEVSASDDQDTWNDVGQGDIYRDPRAGTSLSVQFPEARGRYWRLTVYDRNDRPLASLQAALLATPRYVAFRAEPNERYWLIFGNADASSPQYDFATLTSVDDRLRAPIVTLGAVTATNPLARPLPWTEAHPALLWGALLLAIVVLAWLAIAAMRNR
jgi:uncharacterized protein DUF3999